ncbi:MAG: DHA2 family efflux MFS transporter permease subunit [Ilumatobacter sp.]|nr:MAG: DHA2 family efflux MFS transporter permease subunit [Ilumatobacter sp.]
MIELVANPPIPRLTLFVSSLAVFAVFLDTTVLFVAFPDITASFPDVAPQQLSWVLNGYTIVFAALLIPMGKLADRRGHRSLFLAGSVVFTTASLLCAVAPDPWTLVAARVFQAVGAAMLVPSSLALVLRATPRHRVPVALAIWGATGAVAGAVGPTLGAALVEVGGWRWVFVINLPVGILTVVLGRRALVESRDQTSLIPAPAGVVLLVLGSVLVTLGLVRGEDWGWLSAGVLGTTLGGAAVLALFVLHQSRTRRPTIDLALFSIRNFRWGNLATIAFSVAFTAMFLSSILFLTNVWQWSILRAGLGVAPGPLMVAVLAPFMGRWAAKIGQRPLLIAGGAIYAFGAVLRLVMLDGEVAYVRDYLPSMIFTGLGVALCLPQLSSVVGQALPPDRLGVGGAVNQALRQFAGTVGVALTIGLTATAVDLPSAVAAFDRVWWVLVVGGVLTTVCSLPLRTGRRGSLNAPTLPGSSVETEAQAPPPMPSPAPTAGD